MSTYQVSHHLLLCATPTKAKCCDPVSYTHLTLPTNREV